jgi:hypothetical protein
MDFVQSSLANPSTVVGATLSGVTIVASTSSGMTSIGATLSGATMVNSTINSGNTISPYAVTSEQYIHVDRNSVAQSSIASITYTKIQHTREIADASGVYDNATNYRFTPTVSGVFLVRASLEIQAMDSGEYANSAIYKNGSLYARGRDWSGDANLDLLPEVTAYVTMNGSTDYLEHFVYHTHPTDRTVQGDPESTFFQAMWVSR